MKRWGPVCVRRPAAGLIGFGAALLAAACTGGSGGGPGGGSAGGPAHPAPSSSRSAPAGSAPASAPALDRQAAAARYLAIAAPGNRRLDHDFDRLDGPDRANLAGAQADLRDIAATERLFDRRLAAIPFPDPAAGTARSLVSLNQSRAALSVAVAGAASVAQLDAFQPLLTEANQPVEAAVRTIRGELGLPPPDTS
jgi:hypothetical protein